MANKPNPKARRQQDVMMANWNQGNRQRPTQKPQGTRKAAKKGTRGA